MLSDPDLRVIDAYGVRAVDHDIAVPAIFVVRRDATIAWRYIGNSKSDRPSLDTLVHEVGRAR